MNRIKKVEEQDTQKEKVKLIKIIILVAVIICILAFGPTLYNKFETAKYNEQQEVKKLEDKKIDLELAQKAEFKEEGFTKKYYTLENDMNDIKSKIAKKEASITFKYTFLPIIVTAIIVAVLLIVFVIKIIVSDMNKMTPAFSNLGYHARIQKQVADQQKVVFDLLNRKITQEELANTKLKPLKCPSCKANVEHGAKKCDYCGTSLIRVKK
jgi:flagellar basal body-associated protein FliL